MKIHRIVGLAALIAFAAACGGSKDPAKSPDATKLGPGGVPAVVAKKFEDALAEMVRRDEKADWSDAVCTSVAQQFLDAVKEQKDATDKPLPEGLYNAGLAYQRCAKHAEAKAQFSAALSASPGFHRAKVQLALYDYQDKGDAVLDQTITKLNDAVIEAKFQNVDALVNLAMLQMKRNGSASGTGCKDDMDCAKLNVQRALAIDDGYMPAFNQLAIYYMNQARARAQRETGKKRRMVAADGEKTELSGQMLDLAALVCSQAIRKNAKYAPIYNTLGLIQVEQRNINNAVQAFNTARTLDPNFFEAQMNYAAVNLSFRGFDKAEEAYRAALKMQPNNYEGRLGLALAIRGQINDSNLDAKMADADAELQKAKQLDGSRPEAYFNEAILIQEFKAKFLSDENKKIEMYESAMRVFDSFIGKAGSGPEYAEAVKNANDRKEDMKKIIEFIREGQQAEAEAKRAAAAEKAKPKPKPAPKPAGN
jgi:tetratricopeptide (TPR) repeat protein